MKKTLLTTALLFLISGLSYGQIISQYIETNSGTSPKGIEILNNTGSTLDFSTNNLVIEKGSNGGAPATDYTLSTGTLAAGAVLVIGTSGDLQTVSVGNGATYYVKAFNFNGDDALVVKYGGVTTDVFGDPGTGDPGTGWTGSGVQTYNQNIQLKSGITTGDTDGFTDPSERFEVVSTDPVNDQTGFGIAPVVLGAAATKLVITEISPSSPTIDASFEVTVQAQDADDLPTNASQDTTVTLSVSGGTGTLSGTIVGTISSGSNSVTFSGLSYDVAESFTLNATNTGGSLTTGTYSVTTLSKADQLVIKDFPSAGFSSTVVSSFTVEAQRSGDSSVDETYDSDITIAKVSGSGTLGGTLTQTAVNGVATFDDVTFSSADSYVVNAGDGSLTSANSSSITITTAVAPTVGSVYITEIADASSYNNEFIELYNRSSSDITLASTSLLMYDATGATKQTTFAINDFTGSSIIPANGFLIIARGATQTAFESEWGSLEANTNYSQGSTAAYFGSGRRWVLKESTTLLDSTTTGVGSNRDYQFPIGSQTFIAGVESEATPGLLDVIAEITGVEGWRLFSAPTSANSYSDLLGDLWTQGSTTGADVTTGDANVKSFNGSEFVTVDDLTANMTVGAGFAVYVYSDDDYDNSGTNAGFPKTLSLAGTESTGSVSPTLNTSASAWTLVGNPYTSTIDWDNLTKTDLKGVVYTYDSSVPAYISYNGTGSLTDGLLAPFQGFFVQTDTGSGTALTIEKADTTSGGTFFKSAPAPVLSFRIDSETQHSQTYFSFTPDGKMGSDNMDALKLTPLDFVNYISVASESEDRLLDINNLPRTLEEEIEIPISINAMKAEGTGWVEREEAMTITWPNFDNIPTDWVIEFVDYQEEVRVDLREEVSYQFTSNSGVTQEKTGSMFEAITPQKQKLSSANRFALVVRPSVVNSNEVKELPSVFALEQNYPNPFNPTTTVKYSVAKAGEVQLSVYNMMGQKVADLVSGTKQAGSYAISWNAEGMASGMYFYRLSAAGQTMTRQMTLIK